MEEENSEVPRKRRKIIERRAKPSETMDPSEKMTEDLSNYLGIARNRTFNELNTKGKEEAGSCLQSLLNDVSDGALTPLMHFTLNAGHIQKLADIKQITRSIIKDHLGFSEERPFTSMSEVEKREVGGHLNVLLKEVSGGALVPLLNTALNFEEVKKLASLKGVHGLETDDASAAVDVKEEPDDDMDVDKLMAAANSEQQIADERNPDAINSLQEMDDKRRTDGNNEGHTSSNTCVNDSLLIRVSMTHLKEIQEKTLHEEKEAIKSRLRINFLKVDPPPPTPTSPITMTKQALVGKRCPRFLMLRDGQKIIFKPRPANVRR